MSLTNPFSFVGRLGIMTESSGILSMRARDYSPGLGRFISFDPTGLQAPSLYSYTGNNPIDYVDPSGLQGESSYTGPEDAIPVYSDPWGADTIGQILNGGPKSLIVPVLKSLPWNKWLPPSDREPSPWGPPAAWPGGPSIGPLTPFPLVPTPPQPLGNPGPPGSSPIQKPKDPNNIIGPAGFGDQNFVALDQTLPYTIDFENEPTAGLPAQQVIITQQLDSGLNWESFRLGSFGWGGQVFQVPANSAFYQTTIDLTQQDGYLVEVTATIDESTGIATWVFTTIDPATGQIPLDPTIGFLPPDDNGTGEGFVSYTILANQADPTGTVINAQATVDFYTQPPLNTPQVFNTIDTGTGVSSTVAALPPEETSPEFDVSWSGTDAAASSAIGSYTIYVSDDGGPYTAWLTNTTLTAAPYQGQPGHTYAFYSVATDNAGNVQATPTAAQASTTVEAATQATSISSIAGSGTYGGTATLTATLTTSGSGLANEQVTFTFINGTIITTVGTATTDADGVAILTGVSLAGIGAGTYTGYVGASFAGDANYSGSGGSGDLTVAQAPLTVTANPAFKTYGDPDPTFTVSYNGFVAGDGASSLSGSLSFATTEPTTGYAPVGTYTVTPSGLMSSNYSITYVGGTLTVGPRALTVTANGASETYGAPTPTLTYTLSGFAPGEDATIAGVTGSPVLGTAATQSSGAGTYAITVGAGTLAAANYDFPNLVAGTLTITPAPLTITADDQSMVYGAPLPVLTASYTGFVNGDTPSDLATPVTLSTDASSSSPVGTYAIQASGATSANYQITFFNGTLTINQAGTTTALAASVNPAVYGQSVTFTATVAAVAPGAGTPTGTINFLEGSTTLDTETLGTSGTVSFSTSALAVGAATITAVYSGDSNFVTSSSSTSETVSQAGTSTNLSASPPTANAGQPITLTATIAVVAPGAGSPTGSVQFFIGTTSLGTADLSGNTAILTTTTLPVGTDSLTAQYLGDPNFTGSTSSAVTVTINPAGIATTTTLTSSTNPSVFGQSVTFTATVTPSSGSGTPTGSVTFYAGSTPLGTATLSSKKASLKTTSVPVGSQVITAVYSGDTTYAPSTSAVLTQTVNLDSTTTKVTSSANPSVYGQSVTLTATVKAASPGSGTPTGTVTFYDGTTNLGSGTLSGGTATLSPTFSVVGSHSITVAYSGDPDFTASTSPALTQTVNQAGTTTAVASVVNPSIYGQQLSFTATVSANSPGSGTPTGTITFYSGSTQLGTSTLSGGIASLTTSPLLSVGNNTIKASYNGDTNFKTSTGTLTQAVNHDATTTSVVSAANPSAYGQSVTVTAMVEANAPGSGMPTGSVTFTNGSTTLGTVTLSGGTASYSTAKLATGLDTITATYNGSSDFTTSSSSVNQAVNQDGTSTVVSSSVNPSVYEQSVTFTTTVSAAAPGSGTPTGSVTFMDGSTALGSATLSSGKASFKTNSLAVGSQSITADYSGDGNFTTSTSTSLAQTIQQDATTTSLKSSANPSVFGQSVTFTATVKAASPGSGTPSGTVTFYDGSTAIGTGTTLGLGNPDTATFTTASLSVGSHAITAVYGGDGNFSTSTSTAINQGVNQAGSSTVVVSSVNPSSSGQAVTFTATVNAVSPGSGTPTGTVTFYDGSTTLGSATLGGTGTASFTTSSLSVGSHSVKVSYGGDADFKASTSAVLNQVVQAAASNVTIASVNSPNAQAITVLQDDSSADLLLYDQALEQVSAQGRSVIRRLRA